MILKPVTDRDRTLLADDFRHELLGGFFFKMPACALRLDLVKRAMPPDHQLYQIHDWEFILRLSKGQNAVLLSEPGAIYRVHDRSISATARAGDRLYSDILRWTSRAAEPTVHDFTPLELKRLKGSCGELLMTGFLPRLSVQSWIEYLRNYARALRIAAGGGMAQVFRMHWSLARKAIRLVVSTPQSRPVVRQV